MHSKLQQQLGDLESTIRRTRSARQLAVCWAMTAGAELFVLLLRAFTTLNTRPLWWAVFAVGLVATFAIWMRASNRPADFNALVNAIEQESPGVRSLLHTAMEQKPDAETGQFSFLQLRVIDQVVKNRFRILWENALDRKLSSARTMRTLAMFALLLVLFLGRENHSTSRRIVSKPKPSPEAEITVTPGDTEIERGTGLVISARFGGTPPAEAMLVMVTASGKTKRIPLERHLADPVFGASLLEVTEGAIYRVEYANKKTGDYKISVFDYPSLTRADAELDYPKYTGQTNQTIRDTRRITAVEGTKLTYSMELNKPVVTARLVGKEDFLPLTMQSNSIVSLNAFTLTNSARYKLELIDADGRTNKTPAEFVIQVLPDRPPEVRIAFPSGDQRVSSLEEFQLQAEARDDFGLLKYGIGFSVAGEEPEFVELGQNAAANEKKLFTNQIALEKLGLEVDQLVSYFAWADDYGPDGQERRTFGDIFFAEIRPFDEVFRADQSGASERQNREQQQQSQNQNGNQGGNQTPRLAELQKQIVIATWKLQRDKPASTSIKTP